MDHLEPKRSLILRYVNEDDQVYLVENFDETRLKVPKNRSVPQHHPGQPLEPLSLAFRLQAWAFIGLAPAGLGTLVLAPLAAFYSLLISITHHLSSRDQKRVLIVFVISLTLLGMAIPMSRLFLALLNP